MAGYLEQYGAGEERRWKIIKILVISLVASAVIGGALYFNFHNFREERQVKEFLGHLESKDYKAAYALFGCTDAKPCRYYPFDKFMEDWGPASGHAGFGEARITTGPAWKTHDLRDRTIRFCRRGLELMRGGYLDLLHYSRQRRG